MQIKFYKYIRVGFPISIGKTFDRFVVGTVKFTPESRLGTTDWFILTGVYTQMNKYFIAFRIVGDTYQVTLASNDFIDSEEFPTHLMYNGNKDVGYLTSAEVYNCKEDVEYIFNLRLYKDNVTLTIRENGEKKVVKIKQKRSSQLTRGTMLTSRPLGRTANGSIELLV